MHGRFPKLNKRYLITEIFPFIPKEEKRSVYFPTKEDRSNRGIKQDMRMSREEQELYEKQYKVK